MTYYASILATLAAQGRVGAKPALRITPSGAGDRSGNGWENAGQLGDLNALIATARANGMDVWLRADQGEYNGDTPILLTNGGAAGLRVNIIGTDGAGTPTPAVISGSRANPWSAGLSQGSLNGTIVFLVGADHLGLSFIEFRNVTDAVKLGGNCGDLLFEDIKAYNVRNLFENTVSQGNKTATISGITVRRCEAHGYSKRFLRLRYDTHDILVEDCVGDSEFQDGDPFAGGLCYMDTAHSAQHFRCVMRNHRDSTHGTGYWNADGFSTERGNYDLYYEACEAYGNTDGGFDFKSTGTVLKNCIAGDNKRNFRLWGEVLLDGCTGLNPAKPPVAQAGLPGTGGSGYFVQVSGYTNSRIRVKNSTFSQTANGGVPAFFADSGGSVFVDQATLDATTVPAGMTKLAPGNPDTDAVTGIWDHADTTAPTITSSGTQSMPENAVRDFLVTTSEPATLEIVGGQDAAVFARTGRNLRVLSQDYENPIDNPLRINIRVRDANDNVSVTQAMAITITDVADDPITPAEAFDYAGSDGCWFDVSQASTLFADVGMTVPAEIDGPVAAIADLSGSGRHARQPAATSQGILRTDGAGFYWIELDGFDDFYLLGPGGGFQFPQMTLAFAHWRDDDSPDTRGQLYSIPRSTNPGTTFNAVVNFGTMSSQTLFARVQSNQLSSASPPPGILYAPRARPLISSLRTADSTVRAQNNLAIDGPDVAALTYPVAQGQPRLFASGNPTPTEFYFGRFYGAAILNHSASDDKLYRVSRQIAQLNGAAI